MWEEREAACIRAIEHGVLDDRAPSRRQRHKILAVDRDGDVAAVLEATRGKRRGSSVVAHAFRRDGGTWVSMGSAGSGSDHPRMEDRSTVNSGSITIEMAGSIGGRQRRAIHDAVIRVGPEVETLRWRGTDRPVSPTGFAIVVWRGRRSPTVEAFDAAECLVDRRNLDRARASRRRIPWRVRLRMVHARRRSDGDWFNYAPRR
ncbi:MAG: hypothetical protein V9E94_07980 [Microthrixaceae bacterium]|mgnify:FL=1